MHRPLRTGPLSSLFFLFSLSLSPPFSVPSQSSPLFAPVYSPVEGEVSVFVSPSQRTGADFMACLGAIPGHKRGSDSNRFRGEQRHSPSLHWIRNRHEILLPSSLFRDSLRHSFAYFELFFDSNSPLLRFSSGFILETSRSFNFEVFAYHS